MRLFSVISAAAVAVAALAVTSDALAQRNRGNAASVVVINSQRVVAESAAGRDMQAKLQQVRTQIGGEAQALAPERQSIEQELARLQNQLRNQSQEQIRNNSQVQAVGQRQQQLQQRAATLQGDLQCSELLALRELNRQVSPIVQQIMRQRGAGVVIDSSSVTEFTPEADITAAVIQQLDATTRTLNVARASVSQCQAAAQ